MDEWMEEMRDDVTEQHDQIRTHLKEEGTQCSRQVGKWRETG